MEQDNIEDATERLIGIIDEKDEEIKRLKAIIGPRGLIALAEKDAEIERLKRQIEIDQTPQNSPGSYADYKHQLLDENKRLREMLHNLYENKLEPDKLYIQIPRYHKEMMTMKAITKAEEATP